MSAFAEALAVEVNAAARDALVELHVWMNGPPVGRGSRVEAAVWADRMLAEGKAAAILEATEV